jgi:hypothetical protein
MNGSQRIDGEYASGLLVTLRDRADRGQVHDGIGARGLDYVMNARWIGEIHRELVTRPLIGRWPMRLYDDITLFAKIRAEMSPDESVGAGDEDPHVSARSPSGVRNPHLPTARRAV